MNTIDELYEKLDSVILETGFTYGMVIGTIKKLYADYLAKGENLLNFSGIQEVSKQSTLFKDVFDSSAKQAVK